MPLIGNATNTADLSEKQVRAAWKAAHRALRTGDPFNHWVLSNSTNACTISASGGVWDNWVLAGGTGATITGSGSTQVWTLWNESITTTGSTATIAFPVRHQSSQRAYNARISPEERARQEARDAEYRLQADREALERKIAEAKAEVLLTQMLTPQQKEDLKNKRCFYLFSGGKKYRIDRGRTGNVKLVDDRDQVVESYCIHPNIACPDADTMLAQKLLLETDPETFERVANITARGVGGRNRGGVGLARAQ